MVGALVLSELGNQENIHVLGCVTLQKAKSAQFIQACFHVYVVRREQLHLDTLGAILKAALTIRQHPQANEQKPILERHLYEILVLPKAGLNVARSHCTTPC